MFRIKIIKSNIYDFISMPYAQNHYPFENKDGFESCFPADFIAEGIDQTRGWSVLTVLKYFLFIIMLLINVNIK